MVWSAVGNFLGRIGGAVAPNIAAEGMKICGREFTKATCEKVIGAAAIAGTAYAGSVLFGGDSGPPQQPYGAWRGNSFPPYPMSPYAGM